MNDGEFDYIVVGSGAGGAPLAARLVEAGYTVLVIEAGSDASKLPAQDPDREVSEVPAMHAVSSEQPDLSWQFFVQHYDQYPDGKRDPKWHEPDLAKGEDAAHHTGIFYPRAAALGGCTIHNAMISIAGPDSDWDDLADFLDDDSWRSNVMRPYFQKLERNEYLPSPPEPPSGWFGRARDNFRWLCGYEPDYTGGRHGFDSSTSWLTTSVADASQGVHDRQLIGMIDGALRQARASGIEQFGAGVDHFVHDKLNVGLDPNHAWRQAHHPEGLIQIPLAVNKRAFVPAVGDTKLERKPGHRSGPRECLLEAQAAHPDKLTIWTECLVTKVVLSDEDPLRATGVELLKGKHLYGAHPAEVRSREPGTPGKATARREVILCGGAFNTPQLLMLSGIGERAQLAAHGIDCRVDLPGVGRNLHDRYEVTVVSEMREDFSLFKGLTFGLPTGGSAADPALAAWRKDGTGAYASNGAVLGVFKRSREELAQPDLFIFGVPLRFPGYEIGYSKDPAHNFFTWAILKAHTQNRDGTVQLRNADPLETPLINFHYFHETSWKPEQQATDPDLEALVDGVKFVDGIARHAALVVKGRNNPDPGEVRDLDAADDQQLRDWIRRETWGHHACGSCRMGPPDDADAVLDSRCLVRGVEGLRVVDASIFPKIPGYFIVTNIYIASEKVAADIILAAKNGDTDTESYPAGLRAAEAEALGVRRAQVQPPASDPGAPGLRAVDAQTGQWPEDVSGLAISGGGVRSATLHLGVLQAMAKAHVLRRVDFLSTVSGGGYVGSFLGRFYDRLRHDPLSGSGRHSPQPGPDRVERELGAPDSKEIDWLRKHGNYLAPGGNGDARFNIAVFLRNILSVHFVTGTLLLAVFGLANAVRYRFFDPASAATGFALGSSAQSVLPLSALLEVAAGGAWNLFWSPWFVLFELSLLFFVVPRMVGYWLASQDEHERYDWPALSMLFIVLAALLFLAVRSGLSWPILFMALSLVSAFIPVELAWKRGRQREEATGAGSPQAQRLRTRNYLTDDLGLALAMGTGALAFAVIDAAGHALQQWVARNHAYTGAFTSFGAVLTALLPVLRGTASYLSGGKNADAPSAVSSLVKTQLTSMALAMGLSLAPLLFYSFVSHAVYQGGTAFAAGAGATALMLALSAIMASVDALPFVNRSSLRAVYADHIAHTYLGASNPFRHHPQGANVKEVLPSDDVDSLRDYRPQEAGGPLHLINVTVNQTVDFNSQHGNRDRKGENMAVSSLGLSIGTKWHGFWKTSPVCHRRSARLVAVEPVALRPGDEHPLIDETGHPASRAEMLALRDWIGISGAAIGPGRGQSTELGTALLFGLANLRTGYWWDSGIFDCLRDGFPDLTLLRRVLYLLPRVFLTQSLLMFEWVAHYPGPWERFWNLADGGFFENLAAYELIRRRVPRIIVGDGGADPDYTFEDFGGLVRKARIDFGARIEPLDAEEIKQLGIPADVQSQLGSLEDMRPVRDAHGNVTSPSRKHAALFKVTYEDGRCPYRSLLLYLKATCTDSEAADVENYRALHPDFPHESTVNQFFNEAQWESYRKLGEDTGTKIFSAAGKPSTWFWTVPLPR